jgi:hypothetical protein
LERLQNGVPRVKTTQVEVNEIEKIYQDLINKKEGQFLQLDIGEISL